MASGASVWSEVDAESEFHEAVAAASDYVATLLVPTTEAQRAAAPTTRAGRVALAEMLVALADSRDRDPGDDEVVVDLDRARRATAASPPPGEESIGGLSVALANARDLALDRAARALPSRGHESPADVPMVASRGVASLHGGVRLAAPPEPAVERAFGSFRPKRNEPESETTPRKRVLRRWARDALEELAIAGRLRRPREDEAWVSGRGFEARLGMAVDVLASLARGHSDDERLDLARATDDSLLEWSIPDPGRTFAAVFALGCIDGANAAARVGLYARGIEPAVSLAIDDALALASSPGVDDVVLALASEDESPLLLARAMRVARRRHRIPVFLATALLEHPDIDVAVSAAHACAIVDPALVREPLEMAVQGPDELAVVAVEALAMSRAPVSVWSPRLLALSTGPIGSAASTRALLLRVLMARGTEAETYVSICQTAPRLAAVQLLGWLGSAGGLELLLEGLGDADVGIRDQAAWSLARITGAGRERLSNIATDEAGNPLDDPDSPSRPDDFDPHRRTPPVHPDFWKEPCANARTVDAPRLRFGKPHAPIYVLDELIDPRTSQGVRRVLLTEHHLLSSGRPKTAGSRPLPLDVDDWIDRQLHWLELARSATGRDGGGALHAGGART